MRRVVKLIVIGGSAGSLQVIIKILSVIRAGFPIPMLLVIHRNNQFESALEEILSVRTPLAIREVEEKEGLQGGTIYVAPVDYHVLLEKDRSFSLDYSEPIHFSRPSIDVSFKSAADIYGDQLVCVLLSGGNADGAEGLAYVRECGGMTVVQDPAEADAPFMPQFALNLTSVDHVLMAKPIGILLDKLADSL